MKVVALAGGVGGAKLAHGLAQALPVGDLTVIVNTGDDFEHLGLHICPDLDTVCYTLAGIANPDTGWGQADESWNALETLTGLGGPDWFRLGDKDLGVHLERTRRLQAGETLAEITASFCAAWGIKSQVLPMSNAATPTIVQTEMDGELPFQEYFVKYHCTPRVTGFRLVNNIKAEPAPGVLEAISLADVIVLCPSNPWVSISPILELPDVLAALQQKRKTIAVSPLIGGKALKGPAAKMYQELGFDSSARMVAWHYRSFLRGFVLDNVDEIESAQIKQWGIISFVTNILMSSTSDRRRLAQEVLAFSQDL